MIDLFVLVVSGLIGLGILWFIAGIVACWYDNKHNTHYSCKYWGWHNGKGNNVGFDGVSLTSRCSKCKMRVLRDSQGNWFTTTFQ